MNEWINIKDKMPKKFENVLAANKRGKQYDIDKAWWNGSCFDRSTKKPYKNVTHWMPLPNPPTDNN